MDLEVSISVFARVEDGKGCTLPTLIHAPAVPEEEETFQRPASTSTPPPVASWQPVLPYGQRNEQKAASQEDRGNQQSGGALQQRILKMTEVVEDPLEPPVQT